MVLDVYIYRSVRYKLLCHDAAEIRDAWVAYHEPADVPLRDSFLLQMLKLFLFLQHENRAPNSTTLDEENGPNLT